MNQRWKGLVQKLTHVWKSQVLVKSTEENTEYMNHKVNGAYRIANLVKIIIKIVVTIIWRYKIVSKQMAKSKQK